MATEHNCFVNPYCSHVLSDICIPYIQYSTIITSFIMQILRHLYVTARNIRHGTVPVRRTGLCMRHGCCMPRRVGTAHVPRVRTALLLRTFDRLDCAANAKITLKRIYVYRCSLYIRYQWWSSCSDLTNTARSRSQARRRGTAT